MVTHFFPLCELPDTVLEQALRIFSYHEISLLRRVNKKFNTMCMALLNKGFRSTEKYCRKYLQVIKVFMFRESCSEVPLWGGGTLGSDCTLTCWSLSWFPIADCALRFRTSILMMVPIKFWQNSELFKRRHLSSSKTSKGRLGQHKNQFMNPDSLLCS